MYFVKTRQQDQYEYDSIIRDCSQGGLRFLSQHHQANLDSGHTFPSTFTWALLVGGHGERLKVSQTNKRKTKEKNPTVSALDHNQP